MIHIENNHPTGVDISMKNSTPKKTVPHKKIYTLQQIHDNVKTIQKCSEQIFDNPIPSSSSCFFSFKQLTKIFKTFRTKPIEQSKSIEIKSPFIFGGETLQWFALPQYNDHIYENELIFP